MGGSALAGKGVTAGESSVAGTNWDTTAGGPNWRHSTVNVAGPAWEHFDVTDPAVGTGWAGPTWAGPTVVEA
ncbi:hypothetical protein Aab01nite_10080 [Paractinoplanes abujensis]|nr:hypothetical protein Aab01nite_10080 [Actinoplanes abujensis]